MAYSEFRWWCPRPESKTRLISRLHPSMCNFWGVRMKESNQYVVPPARLNVAYGNNGDYGSMPCSDAVYRIPIEWLKANAKRFHFTEKQILDAAVKEFHAPDLPPMARCYGIYFLIRNKEIVYVGMSRDIPGRIDQHKENGMPFDSFAWFEAPENFLRDIEAYYIRRIKPFLNNDYPRSMYFQEAAQQFDTEPPKKRVLRVITVTPPKAPWILSLSSTTETA